MLWQSLALIDGWDYQRKSIERAVVQPGLSNMYEVLSRRMSGWGINITLLIDSPYATFKLKEDFIEYDITPYGLWVGGLHREFPGVWLSRFDPTNSLYQLNYMPNPPACFRGLLEIHVIAADRHPVTGAWITTPCTVLGGQVVYAEITDEDEFRKSFLKLLKGEFVFPLKEE